MNTLTNAFSLLELDVEDDREQTTSAADKTEKDNGICFKRLLLNSIVPPHFRPINDFVVSYF